ncbi:PDR/VanB family oxidoreductase [Amycolatopsis thermoflava]|uniref:PDR/VanB family oxidoreductase n=1 Tax=Amycolatopsis thermoflava TaxID=84480 RepID=UPI00381ED9CB
MSSGVTTRSESTVELDAVITRRRIEAEGVVSLTLTAASGEPMPPWEPGAHIDVLLPGGVERQYSLCGDPNDRSQWRIAILREDQGRGGSRWLHDNAEEGGRLRVRGPRNNFPLVEADRYLFIGGGIGITPLLTMIRRAQHRGAHWNLVYGGRRESSMAFLDELRPFGDRVRILPEDVHGLLDVPGLLAEAAEGTVVYCCGPTGLLDVVQKHCADRFPGALHIERFTPAEPVGPREGDRPVEVVCEYSEKTVVVPPGQSILEALLEEGVEVESSCSEGTCGTCEVAVRSGIPDHRDSVLTEDERAAGETMMICVSRARSDRLVLDI